MSDYTPTTELVRQAYSAAWDQVTDPDDLELVQEQAKLEFNLWLEAHDREVKAKAWQEGAAAGLHTGLVIGEVYLGRRPGPIPQAPENPYTEES